MIIYENKKTVDDLTYILTFLEQTGQDDQKRYIENFLKCYALPHSQVLSLTADHYRKAEIEIEVFSHWEKDENGYSIQVMKKKTIEVCIDFNFLVFPPTFEEPPTPAWLGEQPLTADPECLYLADPTGRNHNRGKFSRIHPRCKAHTIWTKAKLEEMKEAKWCGFNGGLINHCYDHKEEKIDMLNSSYSTHT